MTNRRTLLAWSLAAFGAVPPAGAQGTGGRPLSIVVPFAAGGSIDALARQIAPRMAEKLGRPVIVHNAAGAGGTIGAGQVARAAPDGHTILIMPINLAMMPALYQKLNFQADRDFTPITQLIASELVLVGSPQLAANSVSELIALARRQPGSLNYGSTGVASPLHFAMELLKARTGIDVQAVPYRGDGPVITAVLANEVQLAVMPIAAARQHIEAGKFKALAVTGARRNRNLPSVPTVAESGVPGYEVSSWQGLFGPAHLPREIVDAISEAAGAAVQDPEVRQVLLSQGQEPVGSPSAAFAQRFTADVALFKDIVVKANIPLQD